MVKLTAELIEQAAQYTNAVRDRELDLRGESGGGRRSGLPARLVAWPSPAACARTAGARFLRGEAGAIRGLVDNGMGFLGSQRENAGEDGEVGH